jgi:hypothetical protein
MGSRLPELESREVDKPVLVCYRSPGPDEGQEERHHRQHQAPRAQPLGPGHDGRNRGEHRQGQNRNDLHRVSEALIADFEEHGHAEAQREPNADRDQVDPLPIRPGRLFRQPRRIQRLELLPDLLAFKVRGDAGFLPARQQALIRGLRRVVVARQADQLRFARRLVFDAALQRLNLRLQLFLFRGLPGDFLVDVVDLRAYLGDSGAADGGRWVERDDFPGSR